MFKHRLFRSPTLKADNRDECMDLRTEWVIFSFTTSSNTPSSGIFGRGLLAWYNMRTGISKRIKNSHILIPHGSLLWLHEALSASPITLFPTGPRSPGQRASSRYAGTFTDQCWIQSHTRCWGQLPSQNHLSKVTWAFSFTCAEVIAGDSASQIRHSPFDQNWMIWRDVALQHFGLTVFGLVAFFRC